MWMYEMMLVGVSGGTKFILLVNELVCRCYSQEEENKSKMSTWGSHGRCSWGGKNFCPVITEKKIRLEYGKRGPSTFFFFSNDNCSDWFHLFIIFILLCPVALARDSLAYIIRGGADLRRKARGDSEIRRVRFFEANPLLMWQLVRRRRNLNILQFDIA